MILDFPTPNQGHHCCKCREQKQ